MRNKPAPARPIIAIQMDGGTGVGLGAPATVMVNDDDPEARGVPFAELARRREVVMLSVLAAVGSCVSVACTVNVNPPAVFGVPVIAPVLELRFSPVGSEPTVIVNE